MTPLGRALGTEFLLHVMIACDTIHYHLISLMLSHIGNLATIGLKQELLYFYAAFIATVFGLHFTFSLFFFLISASADSSLNGPGVCLENCRQCNSAQLVYTEQLVLMDVLNSWFQWIALSDG